MGSEKTVPSLEDVVDLAATDFWDAVVKQYPQVKTDDIDPVIDAELLKGMRMAIQHWLRVNMPRGKASAATCEMAVEMRPPKKGERGWMVQALTADDALAEVLRESEELGWIAKEDHDDLVDENGMHAVTITFRPAMRAYTQDELAAAQGYPDVGKKIEKEGVAWVPPRWAAEASGSPTPGGMTAAGRRWAAFVESLPPHKGWRATWEHPGFVSWSHDEVKERIVCATPDWHAEGEIAFEVQDTDRDCVVTIAGRFHEADIPWPMIGRTVESYMAAVSPRLDEVLAAYRGEPVTHPPEDAYRQAAYDRLKEAGFDPGGGDANIDDSAAVVLIDDEEPGAWVNCEIWVPWTDATAPKKEAK